MLKNKTALLLIILANLIFVAPSILLYYLYSAGQSSRTNSSEADSIFNILVFPAIFIVLIDLVFMVSYARRQGQIAKTLPPPEVPKSTALRYAQSGLFWFNLLAIGPCIFALVAAGTADDGDATGYALGFLAFAPIALAVLLIDIYRFIKWAVKK